MKKAHQRTWCLSCPQQVPLLPENQRSILLGEPLDRGCGKKQCGRVLKALTYYPRKKKMTRKLQKGEKLLKGRNPKKGPPGQKTKPQVCFGSDIRPVFSQPLRCHRSRAEKSDGASHSIRTPSLFGTLVWVEPKLNHQDRRL